MRRTTETLRIVLGLAITAWMIALPAQAADLIDVRGTVEAVFTGPGGDPVAQLEWGVFNVTTDASVSVLLDAYVVYSNGLRQQVFPPQVHQLEPGGGFINLGFVVVPGAAGSGIATFHITGRVQRVDGSDGGSGTVVVDQDTFAVP